jgi:2-polyprenyl-3-methyl-5-hydroxy-6-metoxy-1,4-benzoquinol methylase
MDFEKCKVCDGMIKGENDKYNLVRCIKCRLIFSKTIFTQDEFENIYNELYNIPNREYSRHSEKEYNEIKDGGKIKIGFNRSLLLKKHLFNENRNSVLEIGSGIGLIGAYIKKKNPKIKYLGIELDEGAFNKSQELNIPTLLGDFSLMKSLDSKFDIIILWEVVEHLQDLNLFIELSYNSLKKGGKIMLSTPNYLKIKNYKNIKKDQLFQDAPPIHLNFFTTHNIANIFKLNHFKIIHIKTKKYPYFRFRIRYFIEFIRSLFGKYEGSTIYLVALKE